MTLKKQSFATIGHSGLVKNIFQFRCIIWKMALNICIKILCEKYYILCFISFYNFVLLASKPWLSPGTSSRTSRRPAAASVHCTSPLLPLCQSSNCRSDGKLPLSDCCLDLHTGESNFLSKFLVREFYQQKAFGPMEDFEWLGPLKMLPVNINFHIEDCLISIINSRLLQQSIYHNPFLTCGLITEQNPKSVPKKGRKLVVFWGNLSEPNLKIHWMYVFYHFNDFCIQRSFVLISFNIQCY